MWTEKCIEVSVSCNAVGISITRNCLTLRDHFPEHRQGLQSGAVPSSVAKLKLTLVYGQLGSEPYRIHHLHTALTDLNLENTQELHEPQS